MASSMLIFLFSAFFFPLVLSDPRSTQVDLVCGTVSAANKSNQNHFVVNAVRVMGNLSAQVVFNNGFWGGSVRGGNSTVYAIGHCSKTLNVSSCKTCLDAAVSSISSCLPATEGRVMRSGCYLKYSNHKFYNGSSYTSGSSGGSQKPATMVSVPLSILGVSVLGASCFAAKNVKEKRKEKHNGGPSASANESIPNFEYEELESATNYFDQSNKLGLGESGSAYKAVLSDGTTVAIKRLSNNPMQSMDAVLKDVDLISGIQHPNLVQLLGYSIKGSEILLVYEYVPNESLDHFLGIANKPILSWDMRKNIIVGTAKGLAYLHQESIIHGDIKQRNILLDENFTAKVADFGLARFFQEGGTRVGTADGRNLGYLAPERHIRGNSTEKADIYSFGMLIIDIVTGKGTAPFLRNVGCSLQTIWSFYLSDNLAECVDPKLRGKFPKRDALRVLNIGLVCAQASDELRPPMSKVVKMLTDGNCAIPPPPHPAPFDL